MNLIIGICGKSEHGKDTCAEYLKEIFTESGTPVFVKSFGYYLREFICILTGIPIEETLTHEQKASYPLKLEFPQYPSDKIKDFYEKYNYHPPKTAKSSLEVWRIFLNYLDSGRRTIREILQFVGTNLMRYNVDQNIWFQLLENDWIAKGRPLTIIPDCRFPNEREFVLKKNGLFFRILRPNHISSNCDPTHPSETSLDNFDVLTIINPMNESLRNSLENLLNEFIKNRTN